MQFSRTTFVLLFSFGIPALKAQSRHQIALNATQFVKQFVVPNNAGITSISPYLIQYRNIRKKMNYRAGIGGNYRFLNEDNQSSRFTRNTDAWSYNSRLGVDFTRAINDHWYFYYGLDALYNRNYSKVSTTPMNGGAFISKSINTQKGYTYGAGGVITIEYRLSPKVTVYTEATLSLTRSRTYEKNENPDFPNSKFETKTRSGAVNFSSPINVFFSLIL